MLCQALFLVARRIFTTSFVHISGLKAFFARCFIALDKRPGVRPIGIEEEPCRIIGNRVLGCEIEKLGVHSSRVLGICVIVS